MIRNVYKFIPFAIVGVGGRCAHDARVEYIRTHKRNVEVLLKARQAR